MNLTELLEASYLEHEMSKLCKCFILKNCKARICTPEG